jgi:hypothetical protein
MTSFNRNVFNLILQNSFIFYKRIIQIIIGMNKYLNTLLWWTQERTASFAWDRNLAQTKSIGIVMKNWTYL